MQDWFQTNIFKIKCLLWRFLNYSIKMFLFVFFAWHKTFHSYERAMLRCPRLLPIGQMRWCHRLFLTVACFSLSASNTSSEPKVRLSERGRRDKADTVQRCAFISVCRFKQRNDKLIKYHHSVYVESIFWKHETQKWADLQKRSCSWGRSQQRLRVTRHRWNNQDKNKEAKWKHQTKL